MPNPNKKESWIFFYPAFITRRHLQTRPIPPRRISGRKNRRRSSKQTLQTPFKLLQNFAGPGNHRTRTISNHDKPRPSSERPKRAEIELGRLFNRETVPENEYTVFDKVFDGGHREQIAEVCTDGPNYCEYQEAWCC